MTKVTVAIAGGSTPSNCRAATFETVVVGATPVPVATIHRRYWEARDPELEAELLRRHEPLALRLAAGFSHRGEPYEDLCQVARIALLRALRNYDPDRAAQFSTYAVPTIVGALKRHFRDRGWLVRPPRRLQEAYLAVSKASEDLGAELGRAPTVQEIVASTGLATRDVTASFQAMGGRRPVPLEVQARRGDGGVPAAVASDHGAQVARLDDELAVAQLLALLPEAERAVTNLWLFDGLTQGQIATRLGTSQSTVSRLRRQALDRLRALQDDDATAA